MDPSVISSASPQPPLHVLELLSLWKCSFREYWGYDEAVARAVPFLVAILWLSAFQRAYYVADLQCEIRTLLGLEDTDGGRRTVSPIVGAQCCTMTGISILPGFRPPQIEKCNAFLLISVTASPLHRRCGTMIPSLTQGGPIFVHFSPA